MNKPASSLNEQDFVRLPADRSMADAIVRPSVSYWRDVLRRIRSDLPCHHHPDGHFCPHTFSLRL